MQKKNEVQIMHSVWRKNFYLEELAAIYSLIHMIYNSCYAVIASS